MTCPAVLQTSEHLFALHLHLHLGSRMPVSAFAESCVHNESQPVPGDQRRRRRLSRGIHEEERKIWATSPMKRTEKYLAFEMSWSSSVWDSRVFDSNIEYFWESELVGIRFGGRLYH